MATDVVFSGYEEDIFLVKNSNGYFIPSFNVMTLEDMCPGEAYGVFLNGAEGIDFTYPSSDGQARSSMYSYWEEYNQNAVTEVYSEVMTPTGISYPVIILTTYNIYIIRINFF